MRGERVGEVTDTERDEILRLHERRNALKELFLTLNSPYLSEEERSALREGIVEDLARTSSLYEDWWREIGAKYHLKPRERGGWMIDFQSKELSFCASMKPSSEAGLCDDPSCVLA